MKKYILILLAAMLFAGCERIDENSMTVNATVFQEQITQMETLTETEITVHEISEAESSNEKFTETEAAALTETEATTGDETVFVGGETEIFEVSVEGISLTFYEVTLQAGEIRMPIVTMFPENASDKNEIWESSNPDIAEVANLGNIKAVSEGSCTITIKSAQNPYVSAEVGVTVVAADELTFIDGILIANKTYALPSDYAPGVDRGAQAAFDSMQAAAEAEGLNIYISSGYRSYDYQAGLYERYVKQSGKSEADRYSARPGHSEHQTGLAFDLNTISDDFKDTAEGKWIADNCHRYGFIIRYPEGKESVTGYIYEPWHIRYLGIESATAVFESGLCLEEYLGITSEYAE